MGTGCLCSTLSLIYLQCAVMTPPTFRAPHGLPRVEPITHRPCAPAYVIARTAHTIHRIEGRPTESSVREGVGSVG